MEVGCLFRGGGNPPPFLSINVGDVEKDGQIRRIRVSWRTPTDSDSLLEPPTKFDRRPPFNGEAHTYEQFPARPSDPCMGVRSASVIRTLQSIQLLILRSDMNQLFEGG